MDTSLLIAIILTALCLLYVFWYNGWKKGFLNTAFLVAFAVAYFVAVKYFGQDGKVTLAVIFVCFAVFWTFFQKKTGKSR